MFPFWVTERVIAIDLPVGLVNVAFIFELSDSFALSSIEFCRFAGNLNGRLASWLIKVTRVTSTTLQINGLPGTSMPLNFMPTVCLPASRGVKAGINLRFPMFVKLHGILPFSTAISSWPVPACDASTLNN